MLSASRSHFPFIDLNHGGGIDGFIAGQKRIINLADDDTIISPGHGPLGNKFEMQKAVDTLIAIKERVKPMIEHGLSMEEVLKENPLSEFENWAWFHIDVKRMTKIVYCLLTEH